MNQKTILLVIIISVLIGAGIFFFTKPKTNTSSPNSLVSKISQTLKSDPTPIPEPTPEPLTENSNLSDEMQKLTLPDFSEDYQLLKDEVNQL